MESQPPKPKNPRKRGPRRRGGGANRGEKGLPAGSASSNQRSASSHRGPPPSPQLRVTCRNITNADKYGTCQAIVPLIQALIIKSNEKLTVKMELDQASVETCLAEAEAVAAARAAFEAQQKEKNEAAAAGGRGDDESQENVTTDGAPSDVETKSDQPPVINDEGSVAASSAAPPSIPETSNNKITVRILYMVPPRKTRRRGEKPGCVYLVLHAPPLLQPPPSSHDYPPQASSSGTITGTETSPDSAQPLPAPANPVDYSAEITKRRVLLVKALEIMSVIAADDSKTKQEYVGAVVLESASQKAWKRPLANTRDRLEGTIFNTPDYLEFFKTKEQEEQARKARPRPAPGGTLAAVAGLSTPATATSSLSQLAGVAAVTEDGQAVSNLVQHLLLKKKEQQSKQQKQQAVSRKSVAAKDATKSKKTTAAGASATKKTKKRKKKGAPAKAGGAVSSSKPSA